MKVTLKLATSLDGRIATASGESKWITGPAAREQVHLLRALHAFVLVGVETVIADDPELTVRLPAYFGPQPTRVVLDSRQRTPPSAKLVTEAYRLPTVVVSTRDPKADLTDAGVTVLKAPQVDGRPDLRATLAMLADYQADRIERTFGARPVGFEPALFVEGGGQVAASFLEQGLVDALEWFRAPIVLGDEGRPAVGGFVLQRLADAPRFKRVAVELVGDGLWERYERL